MVYLNCPCDVMVFSQWFLPYHWLNTTKEKLERLYKMDDETVTKEQFDAMEYADRLALFKSSHDQYEALNNMDSESAPDKTPEQMNYQERLELFKNNKDEYDRLFKGGN